MAKKVLALICFFTSVHFNSGQFREEYYGNDLDSVLSSSKKSYPFCRDVFANSPDINEGYPQCAKSVEGLLEGLSKEVINYRDEMLPPWINLPLAIKGQQFAMDHITSIATSYLYGLTLLLAIPQIRDPLLFTGKSETPQKATRRYAATIVQVFLWMRRALSKDPKDNWVLQSLANVRFIHSKAALKIKATKRNNNETLGLQAKIDKVQVNKGLWDAFHADLERSNIPMEQRILPKELLEQSGDNITYAMSQFAFAMTQWAFLGTGVTRPNQLFMPDITDEDIKAYSHFWAVIGYAIGIDDEYNVALKPDAKSLTIYLEDIFQKYFIPSLFNLSHGSKILLESYMLGASDIVIGLGPELLLRLILKEMVGIPTPNLDKRRDLYGMQSDAFVLGVKVPTTLFPVWAPLSSPLISLYHFHIGFRFFGQKYSSDENISKHCFYY